MEFIIGEIRQFAFNPESSACNKLQDQGWIICDGRSLEIKYHKELFSAIGNNWGSENRSTLFSMPDLSGSFLRGISMSLNRTKDIEANIRISPRPDIVSINSSSGNSGNMVGSFQNESFQHHTHIVTALTFGGNSAGQSTTSMHHGPSSSITSSVSGGVETRPNNHYVLFMIYGGVSTKYDREIDLDPINPRERPHKGPRNPLIE